MEFLKPNKLKIFLTILLIPFSVLILLYGFGCGFSGEGVWCAYVKIMYPILFFLGETVFWVTGTDLHPMSKESFPLSWIVSVIWLYFIACVFYFLVEFFYKNRHKLIIRIIAMILIAFFLFNAIPIIVEMII